MESAVIVVSNVDGRKYKMVMKGDLATIPATKIKRYLQTATGVPAPQQLLSFNNVVVNDEATGAELGLYDGAVLFLDTVFTAPASPLTRGRQSPPSAFEAMLADKEDEAIRLRQQLNLAREKQRLSETNNTRMERMLQEQQHQLDELKRAVVKADTPKFVEQSAPSIAGHDRLRRTLIHFASQLQLDDVPSLDANNTAVVPVALAGTDITLLLTYDTSTERLYLYATLLSELPQDPSRRLALYEVLLEGALLGRDMAGGGVGVSVKSELVLLSISIDLRHSDDRSLSSACSPFLDAFSKWSEICRRFVS